MDLAITACLMAMSAVVTYRVCRRYSLRSPIRARRLLGFLIVLSVWVTWTTGSQLIWARWIPHGSVLLLANASLLLLAGGSGLISGSLQISGLRRTLIKMALAGSAMCFMASAIVRPLWNPISLAAESQWKEGVCLQSHEASCAPAAAATLLNLHGIQADEQRMARQCLTSASGTMTLGAFRGVYRETRSTPLSTHAVVCDAQHYPSPVLERQVPMMALVNFTSQLEGDWQRSQAQQRRPGFRIGSLESFSLAGHSEGQPAVVLLDRLPDGSWLVADPAVGKTRWSDAYFRSVWVGEGIYLARY